MDCTSALKSGKVKALRLAHLGHNGEVIVQSVDHVFSDEYFTNIGICSYTWGHERVDWYDNETALTWKISHRAEAMCRAALNFFDRVWLDGVCMVQAWQSHIELNMGFMGKLYYHGTVVTEMAIGLRPEYCYRGWVQQEISFTKILCVIKPLLDFINSDMGKKEIEFMHQNKQLIRKSTPDILEPFQDRHDNQKVLIRLLEDLKIYLFGLQRIIQGRDQEDFNENIEEICDDIEGFDFFLCDEDDDEEEKFIAIHWVYKVFDKLIEKIPSVVRLPREMDDEQVLIGALASFRTGFFRFNSDRVVASFSLAEYVLEKGPGELLSTLDTFSPTPQVSNVDVVIANPGRWCTGLAANVNLPTAHLSDIALKFFPFMAPKTKFDDFPEISRKSNLDRFFSIIHSVDVALFDKYEYVLGYKKLDKVTYALYVGMRNQESPDRVLGLINIHIQNALSFFVSNQVVGGTEGWLIRAIALVNSSYHVYCLGADENTITNSPINIIDNQGLPRSDYFTPMFGALRYLEYALGAFSNYVSFNPIDGQSLTTPRLTGTIYKGRESEVLDMLHTIKTEDVVWGSDSSENPQF